MGHVVAEIPEDHPRGCGEHKRPFLFVVDPGGSSPRMRGARNGDYAGNVTDGIIPADAGSTVLALSIAQHPRDHPRGCGEHLSSS